MRHGLVRISDDQNSIQCVARCLQDPAGKQQRDIRCQCIRQRLQYKEHECKPDILYPAPPLGQLVGKHHHRHFHDRREGRQVAHDSRTAANVFHQVDQEIPVRVKGNEDDDRTEQHQAERLVLPYKVSKRGGTFLQDGFALRQAVLRFPEVPVDQPVSDSLQDDNRHSCKGKHPVSKLFGQDP